MGKAKVTAPRNLIVEAIRQYVANPGGRSYEEERTVCKMGDGGHRTFVDGDPDLEAFFANEHRYWTDRGYHLMNRDGKKTLVHPDCVKEGDVPWETADAA